MVENILIKISNKDIRVNNSKNSIFYLQQQCTIFNL